MGRLEELYGGELYPDEKITGHGPEYEEIRENLDKIWEELKGSLQRKAMPWWKSWTRRPDGWKPSGTGKGLFMGSALRYSFCWKGCNLWAELRFLYYLCDYKGLLMFRAEHVLSFTKYRPDMEQGEREQ